MTTPAGEAGWTVDVLAGCEVALAEALGAVGGMTASPSATVDVLFGDEMITVTLTDAAVEHLTGSGNADGSVERGILWIHGAGFELRRATQVPAEKR